MKWPMKTLSASIKLSKALIGQQFDGDKFVPEEARRSSKPDSQHE